MTSADVVEKLLVAAQPGEAAIRAADKQRAAQADAAMSSFEKLLVATGVGAPFALVVAGAYAAFKSIGETLFGDDLNSSEYRDRAASAMAQVLRYGRAPYTPQIEVEPWKGYAETLEGWAAHLAASPDAAACLKVGAALERFSGRGDVGVLFSSPAFWVFGGAPYAAATLDDATGAFRADGVPPVEPMLAGLLAALDAHISDPRPVQRAAIAVWSDYLASRPDVKKRPNAVNGSFGAKFGVFVPDPGGNTKAGGSWDSSWFLDRWAATCRAAVDAAAAHAPTRIRVGLSPLVSASGASAPSAAMQLRQLATVRAASKSSGTTGGAAASLSTPSKVAIGAGALAVGFFFARRMGWL